jgi:hypothetical protein
MRALVFDAGPVISLALNNLLWLVEPLKQRFNGSFFMTKSVKKETIDVPLESKDFSFEALQVMELVKERVFEIAYSDAMVKKAEQLLGIANNTFYAHNHPIKIVHFGEMETLACCIEKGCNCIVLDERTTRYLIEKPKRLHMRLERKLHTKITVDEEKLKQFSEMVRGISVIRSIELVTIAFELGFLDRYLPLDGDRKKLLDSVVWGLKLKGCAVSTDEIIDLEKIEK